MIKIGNENDISDENNNMISEGKELLSTNTVMMTTRNFRMGTRKQTRKITDIDVIDKKKTKVKELPIVPCFDIEHIEEEKYKEDDNIESLRIEREKI